MSATPAILLGDPREVARGAGNASGGSRRTEDRAGGGAAPSVRRSRSVELLTLVLFAVLTAFFLARHSMWFDEMEAWNVARTSRSLGDLWSNLRYEGHPILWYLPLFAITRFTGDPRWMQALHWAIAVGVAALVLFRSPFRLSLRVALCFGYFLVFEFAVVSRSYGLGALLFLVAVSEIRKRDPRWFLVGLALVLLAFANAIGAVLAGTMGIALLGALGWDRLRAWRSIERRRLIVAVGACGAAALSALSCRPPDDVKSFVAGISMPSRYGSGDTTQIASALSAPWRALVPLPELALVHVRGSEVLWNSQVLDRGSYGIVAQALLSVVLVVVVGCALHDVLARWLWLGGSVLFSAMFLVSVLPEQAHYSGALFVVFLGAVWLEWTGSDHDRDAGCTRPPDVVTRTRWIRRLFVVVVAIQCIAALLIAVPLTVGSFGPDRAFADATRTAGLASELVSADDFAATTVGGYLDVDVYSIPRGQRVRSAPQLPETFFGHLHMTRTEGFCTAAEIATRRERPVGLVAPADWTVPNGARQVFSSGGIQLVRITPGLEPAFCDGP